MAIYRTGLVAYHIIQSGISCRLPRTPRSKSFLLFPIKIPLTLLHPLSLAPRSQANHYFDETFGGYSEAGSAYPITPGGSAYPFTPGGSALAHTPGGLSYMGPEAGPMTLDDISPDAL